MKILITGAAGYLGNYIYHTITNDNKNNIVGFDIRGKEVQRLDITNSKAFKDLLIDTKPDLIIHTAAMKDLAECEKNKQKSFLVNSLSTEIITEYVKEYAPETKVIYISSDVIFDGTRGNYSPSDTPNPINWYGKTKCFSEIILKSIKNYVILRTALIIGEINQEYINKLKVEVNNSILQNQTLLPYYVYGRLMNGKEVKLPTSIISNPTPLPLLGEAITSLVDNFKVGTYHITGSTQISRFDFAKEIIKKFNLNGSLLVIDESSIVKYRPKNISFNSRESMKALKLDYDKWTIDKYLSLLNFDLL